MSDAVPADVRALRARAALLFFFAMLTGLWVAVVFTQGKALQLALATVPKHPRLALGAHLNAIFGCLWLLGLATTLDRVQLSQRGRAWLVRLTTLVAFANWAVTLLASVLDARGLAFEGNGRNDLVAALLLAAVVAPGLSASALWAWSLRADLGANAG